MGRKMRKSPHKDFFLGIILIDKSFCFHRSFAFSNDTFLYFYEFLLLLISYWVSWILLDQSQLVPFTVAPNVYFCCKLFVPSHRLRTIFCPIFHCYNFSQRNSTQGHLPAHFTLLIKLTYSQKFLLK